MAMLSSETNIYPISSDRMSANFKNIQMQEHSILEKWIVILLDTNTNRQRANENSIKQQCDIASDIKLFSCVDRCIDFLTDVHNEKVCLILFTSLAKTLLPMIHDLPQLKFVYILNDNEDDDALWTSKWAKIKGSFSSIVRICDQFRQSIRKSEYDLISISIVSSSAIDNLNKLDSSFMYSQLLKDILLKMPYNKTAKADFVDYLRGQYANNPKGLEIVNTFEQKYHDKSPILWYSKEVFIYASLNRALRTQDTETIIRMGFYIQDLHRAIQQLHKKQRPREKMLVYRGQAMTETDFKKLQRNKDGLLSFNNFLSTSVDEQVSRMLAESSVSQENSVGILFRIEIDPSISFAPFASLKNISQYETEEEILFSMHTIFRIDEIEKVEERVWQVNLTSTGDNDEQLKQVTEYMHQQIQSGSADKSLGYLLFRMGEYDIAKTIYDKILQSTSDDDFRMLFYLYNILGGIEHAKSAHHVALSYYQNILDMCPLPFEYNDLSLTDVYSNMASVHQSMGNYSTASELFEIAAEIRERSPSCNSVDLGTIYNNIAVINNLMGRHLIALKYFQKSLNILELSLPFAHPDLAIIYNNIGAINNTTGEREIALRYFEKALKVQEKSLPPTHSTMATTFNNLAMTSHWIGQYQTAMGYYQRALDVLEQTRSSDHPELAVIYNNIGQLHKTMGGYNNALPYYLKALDIQKTILPSTDPKLAVLYINIGMLYNSMGSFHTATEYLEKALEIQKASLSSTHPELARTYHSIGMIYQAKEQYSKALCYHKKALNIQKTVLSSTHPDLACIYNNLAGIESCLKHDQTALDYIREVLRIQKVHLPSNHPDFARTYCNMGAICMGMEKYSEAKGYFMKALNIQETTLPSIHPDLGKVHNNIGMLNCMMGNYSDGLEHLEKARKILASILSPDHPDLMKIHENIAKIHQVMSL